MDSNTLVWVKENEWVKGIKKNSENNTDTHSIVIIDDEEISVDNSNIEYRNTDENDDIHNLIKLANLNEPSILNAVCMRYKRDQIYTYTGPILIAVNPFKSIDVYDDYNNIDIPHVYGVSNYAYNQMLENKTDQSIMVSGESGAGKTQSTKYILQYMAQTNKTMKINAVDNFEIEIDQNVKNIENKIMESNPIIEAFGNAKTKRNDNSSRFGKLITLQFMNSGKLTCANIETYLLERVRLIKNFEGERNFHIFYLLLKGLTELQKQEYKLDNDYCNYNILKYGPLERDDNIDDQDEYNALLHAFQVMNFNDTEVSEIFALIIAILHLGNIEPAKGDITWGKLTTISQLIGIDSNLLVKLFSEKEIKVGTEVYKINYEIDEIQIVITSFMKVIYIQLFDWIVNKINIVTNLNDDKNKRKTLNIRILDIFGFEVFDNNSFEQLCINYTNECLQQIFTQFTIKVEQSEYNKEGIRWDVIEYPDNQICIDMFDKKKGISVFNLLEEQCLVPKGSSDGFYNKINNDMKNFPLINVDPKKRVDFIFTIKHYANDVSYSTIGMVSKNKDTINPKTLHLLKQSNKPMMNSIEQYTKKGDKKGDKKNNRTVSGHFREQLVNLKTLIIQTDPHFIRCIKPNDLNVHDMFVHQRVLEQLRYNGVLSAVKIARSGYPVQLLKNDFSNRYWFLYETGKVCPFLDSLIKKEFDYQVGKRKIFLKSYLHDELEKLRFKAFKHNIIIIQSCVKRLICFNRFNLFKQSSTYLSGILRRSLYRNNYVSMLKSKETIYRLCKKTIMQSQYLHNLYQYKNITKLFIDRFINKKYLTTKCASIFLVNKFKVFIKLRTMVKNEQQRELEELRRLVKYQQQVNTNTNTNTNIDTSANTSANTNADTSADTSENHNTELFQWRDGSIPRNSESVKKQVRKEIMKEVKEVMIQEVKNEIKEEMKEEMKEEVKEEIRQEIIQQLENEYKERAIDLIIKAKKDDIDVIDRVQTENSQMTEQINTMQSLLDACLEREEHYRRTLQRRNEYQSNHNNNCNVM